MREDVSNVAEVPNYVRFQIIDGPALVYMIKPDPGSTFDQFADKIYHYLDGRLKNVNLCKDNVVYHMLLCKCLRESSKWHLTKFHMNINSFPFLNIRK